jgi:HPt (histidine-containing phosphotransfer) domain-containing protein
MDDFLTKPIDVELLASTLDRWCDPDAPADDSDDEPPAALDRLDLARLEELRTLDGGVGEGSYVVRAIGNLLRNAPADLEVMSEAAATGDAERLGATSHRLAGAALNLGATQGGEAARALEDAVRSGVPPAEVTGRLSEVRALLGDDLRALAAFREQLLEPAS